MDDEFRMGGEPGTSAEDADVGAAGAGEPPAWEHLATFEETRKENVQQPMAWAGAAQQKGLDSGCNEKACLGMKLGIGTLTRCGSLCPELLKR